MFWCARQIRAKGYIAFLLSVPLFSSRLEGVGGRQPAETDADRAREIKPKTRFHFSTVRLTGQTLVSGVCSAFFFLEVLISRGGWSSASRDGDRF